VLDSPPATGNIKLEDDFHTSAGSTLTLVSDGTSWNEIGRSSNTVSTSTTPSCLDTSGGTYTPLNGAYAGSPPSTPSYTNSLSAPLNFDARTATFLDTDFVYPIVLSGSAGTGTCWYGGQAIGNYPPDPGWKYMHDGNMCS